MSEGEKLALGEFLVFTPPTCGETAEDAHKWTHKNTLLLLEMYKKYRDQVGSLKIKNLKRMFEEIAKEMQRVIKTYITPANCENRWKVLERNYKKYIENMNKTGRGRKVFEYYDVMHDILGKNKNINPVLLLSSDTINIMNNKGICNNITENTEVEKEMMETGPSSSSVSTNVQVQEKSVLEAPRATPIKRKQSALEIQKKTTYENKRLKYNILKEIRTDRKAYYAERLEIEKKKLEVKLKKNDILEKRNQLLEKIAENNIGMSSELLE